MTLELKLGHYRYTRLLRVPTRPLLTRQRNAEICMGGKLKCDESVTTAAGPTGSVLMRRRER